MPAYPTTYTIDGVGVPRVFVVGNNLILNSGFEENADDWNAIPGTTADFNRYAAGLSTWFGAYVLQNNDGSLTEARGVTTIVTLPNPCDQDPANSTTLSNKRFLLSWWDFSLTGATYNIQIVTSGYGGALYVNGSTSIYADPEQRRKVATFTFPGSLTGNTFALYFYAGVSSSVVISQKVFLDEVTCHEVINDLDLREPDTIRWSWDRATYSDLVLIDKTKKRYGAGKLFKATITYNYLSITEETHRRIVDDGNLLVVMPHKDVYWFETCLAEGDYDMTYFGNIMAGHVGSINLASVHTVKNIPRTFVAATTNI